MGWRNSKNIELSSSDYPTQVADWATGALRVLHRDMRMRDPKCGQDCKHRATPLCLVGNSYIGLLSWINRLQYQLDDSMAHRQLKSPQSLPGRSIPLTLVTKWSWSLPWMTYCHLLCAMSISPPILRYNYFKIWPWKSMVKVICVVKGQGHIWPSKFKGQGYGQVQTHWSHLRPGVQLICLLFVSWQSDNFWLRYSKFCIWPSKFKVKVMARVKPDGHIWALEFNRYVCFSFRGNRTIFGCDIANSIFDLEKSKSRSWRKSTKI